VFNANLRSILAISKREHIV